MIGIIDWLGTAFLLFGAFMISSKKAVKPIVRLFAFSAYNIVCICYITVGYLVGAYGLMFNQFVLLILNTRGLYHSIKELKNANSS